MKYNLEWLKSRSDAGERIKYLFFWGHAPKGQTVDKSCFSQWFQAPFEFNGEVFNTAEHWMMAQKAKLFADTEVYEMIMAATSPGEAKKLGRQVRNFDERVWNEQRSAIVVEGNCLKFRQNPELGTFLKQTGSRVLVEASPVDAIWGIGMAQDHRNIEKPWQWRGFNLLGFALMEVRDRIGE